MGLRVRVQRCQAGGELLDSITERDGDNLPKLAQVEPGIELPDPPLGVGLLDEVLGAILAIASWPVLLEAAIVTWGAACRDGKARRRRSPAMLSCAVPCLYNTTAIGATQGRFGSRMVQAEHILS